MRSSSAAMVSSMVTWGGGTSTDSMIGGTGSCQRSRGSIRACASKWAAVGSSCKAHAPSVNVWGQYLSTLPSLSCFWRCGGT